MGALAGAPKRADQLGSLIVDMAQDSSTKTRALQGRLKYIIKTGKGNNGVPGAKRLPQPGAQLLIEIAQHLRVDLGDMFLFERPGGIAIFQPVGEAHLVFRYLLSFIPVDKPGLFERVSARRAYDRYHFGIRNIFTGHYGYVSEDGRILRQIGKPSAEAGAGEDRFGVRLEQADLLFYVEIFKDRGGHLSHDPDDITGDRYLGAGPRAKSVPVCASERNVFYSQLGE